MNKYYTLLNLTEGSIHSDGAPMQPAPVASQPASQPPASHIGGRKKRLRDVFSA